jgi:hypothetical protein
VKDSLKIRIEGYFDSLKKWMDANEQNRDGVDNPFVPDPSGAPLLYLFPPASETQKNRNEFVEQLLSVQRATELSRKLNKREIILLPATP